MAKKQIVNKKKRGVLSKQTLYSYASQYAKEAIEVLVELMKNAEQDSVKMGAAGKLLDKCLADLKTSEVEVSGNVRVHIVEDKHNNNNE